MKAWRSSFLSMLDRWHGGFGATRAATGVAGSFVVKHLKCRVFCCVVHVRNRALASRRTGILASFAPRCPASAHHYSRSLLLLLLPACLSSCVLACWFVSGSLRSFLFSGFIGLQADQGWYGETGRGPKWSIAEWQRQTVAGLSPHTDR